MPQRYKNVYDSIRKYIRKLLISETKLTKEQVKTIRISFQVIKIERQIGGWECGYILIELFHQLMITEWEYSYLNYDNSKKGTNWLLQKIWPYFVKYTMNEC